tara:strand:+ start:444 stop:1130 length:687 start_codon:yes stop_codon:yes gene_type:complete
MKKENEESVHLIRNLERISPEKSIIDYKYGRKAFLSLGQGDIREWLETLLPNTRIILEPKIIGTSFGIQYVDGKLNKAINENSRDITEVVRSLINIPKNLPVKKKIELRGILYNDENTSKKYDKKECRGIQITNPKLKKLRFCAFQIFHCNINHFQALQELKNLNFEIPETQYTNFISDVEIYLQCWKEGKLFKRYPTSGIVLKINSRKLQKVLGQNKLSINWAYSLN